MIKVGIPRALLYFKFFPLWKRFLEELGCEVILSPKTNKHILEKGVELGFNELCLPIKLYYGHMAMLLERNPDLDHVFIPRYISLDAKGFYCPKFLSLPDAMRAAFKNIPSILEWEVNAKKQLKIISAIAMGRQLGITTTKIVDAYQVAVKYYKDYQEALRKGLHAPVALECVEKGEPYPDPIIHGELYNSNDDEKVTIFILGHPYNTFEEFTNMQMFDKIQELGANILAVENLPREAFTNKVLVNDKFENYWGNEQEILQASNYIYNGGALRVDGVIFLISFACGPDSLIAEIVMRDMKKRGIPYMRLILDEHTGSAGMMTRIETFVEMIKRKKIMKVILN
ncbi:MAG: acyl-CoA dehydratase activase-related protein [Promethearchaeota archaeon]